MVVSSVVSSLLLIEHINLNVGDERVAALFYVEGLGCCPDPFRASKMKSLHVNVGALAGHSRACTHFKALCVEHAPDTDGTECYIVLTF